MAATIEEFVAKLQSDGVAAGQKEAQRLQDEAKQQAEQTVAQAQAQAEKIVADAQAEAESVLARSKTDLELTARDAVTRLRETLLATLNSVFQYKVGALDDENFLKGLIHDLVMQYAQADVKGQSPVKLSMTADMQRKLAEFVINEIHQAADGRGLSIDLKGDLKQAGFEYSGHGGMIEITEGSVAAALAEMVSPMLREILTQSAAVEE